MSKQRQYIKEKQKRNTSTIPLEYHANISQAEADTILAGKAEWDKYAGDSDVTVIGPELHIMDSRNMTRWKKPIAVNGKALIGKGNQGFYTGMAYIIRAEEGANPNFTGLELFLEFDVEMNHHPGIGPLNRRMDEIGAEWTEIPNGNRKDYIW